MGQLKSKILHQAGAENIDNLQEDPDDQWSNLYRERKKNHLYKWVGIRSGKYFQMVASYCYRNMLCLQLCIVTR